MIQLNPDEARVLGVLIEKALTTPDQYPLSLNAVHNGCNQKNNRDPVLELSEDRCFDALETLRDKQLVVRVDQLGARVPKFKQTAMEVLQVRTAEVAILAELLLRGPQTLGELRGRASRMSSLESLDRVRDMIRALSERSEPLVKELPRQPGTRAESYAQLLCADCHGTTTAVVHSATPDSPGMAGSDAGDSLADRVAQLEDEVRALREIVDRIAGA